MVLPGHLAGGYLATSAVLSLAQFPLGSSEIIALYIIGTLAGEIPDIDLLFFYFENKKKRGLKNETHRKYLTHIPLFWVLLSLAILIIALVSNSLFILALSLVVLAGTLSHFIFDSIDYGIQWLRPISKKRFCLFEMKIEEVNQDEQIGSFSYYFRYVKNTYIKQPSFYAELFVTVLALIVLIF